MHALVAIVQAVEANGNFFINGRPVSVDFSKGKLLRTSQLEDAAELKGVKQVLVGGLALSVSQGALRDVMGSCGDVEDVIMLDTRDALGHRQALVAYKLEASVPAALALTGRKVDGEELFVQCIHMDREAEAHGKRKAEGQRSSAQGEGQGTEKKEKKKQKRKKETDAAKHEDLEGERHRKQSRKA